MNSHKFAEAKQKFSPTKWSKYVIMFSGAIIIVGIIMIAVMGFNLGMDIKKDPIRIWSYYNTESSVPYNAELVVNNRLIQRLHS